MDRKVHSLPKSEARERWVSWIKSLFWWVLLLAAFFPLAFRQVSVSDAWWHVALGKWLVEERSMPDLSRFYFSPWNAGSLGSELRWEWLGDIALYFCHLWLSSLGLQILVVACILLASFFLIKSGSDRVGGWTLLLLVAVCLGTYQLQLLRNSLFSRWWRSYCEPSAWTRKNPLLLGISIWNSTGAPRFVNGWVARLVVLWI
jgi:hypothetical protein